MGDPASPLAFLLYMSDFRVWPHRDDIVLDGIFISHLEHADDLVLFSTSQAGLQAKLDALAHWASSNQMEVNTRKTVIMLFRKRSSQNLPVSSPFHISGHRLEVVEEQCYVGIWFCSHGPNNWHAHISKSAEKARRTANITFFVQSHTGPIPPEHGKTLYTAQVDPNLTWGMPVTGLGTLADLKKLESVQLAYLRRLLAVQKHSEKSFLFTETSLWPIKFRRLKLQLSYLLYLLSLPRPQLARAALMTQLRLAVAGKGSWMSDLARHLDKLGLPITAGTTLDTTAIESILTRLQKLVLSELEESIYASHKLELLQLRQRRSALGAEHSKIMELRTYLLISDRAVRRALTQVLVSDHPYALERLRWKPNGLLKIPPRHRRVCRFCFAATEEPLHVLFVCNFSPELVEARRLFWQFYDACRLLVLNQNRAKSAARKRATSLMPAAQLQAIPVEERLFHCLQTVETAEVLGSFCLRASSIFDTVPMYIPLPTDETMEE